MKVAINGCVSIHKNSPREAIIRNWDLLTNVVFCFTHYTSTTCTAFAFFLYWLKVSSTIWGGTYYGLKEMTNE